MTNIVIVDVDTERENPILIQKTDSTPPPTTPEEAKESILKDIECLSEAILTLIHIAIQSNYTTKDESIEKLNGKITQYVNSNS